MMLLIGSALEPVSEAAEFIGQDAGSLYALADILQGFAIDKFIELIGLDNGH